MMSGILTKTYDAPSIDRSEILRYAGIRGREEEMEHLLDECLDKVLERLTYRVCFGEFLVTFHKKSVDLSAFRTESESLIAHLSGCGRAILFGATVGVELDRLIARYSAISPTRALLLQAIGTERIEALCDTFEADLRADLQKTGQHLGKRFSPGYGDLSIEVQREIFLTLGLPKRIGLTLNDSLLMSPTKSVTAILGIAD